MFSMEKVLRPKRYFFGNPAYKSTNNQCQPNYGTLKHMFHSQILVPFRQFSINPDISGLYGKFSELYFNVLLSSNCGEKVLKHKNSFLCGTTFQCYLVDCHRDWRTMVHWNIVWTIFFKTKKYLRVYAKIVAMTFQCIIVLQLRGDWPKHA